MVQSDISLPPTEWYPDWTQQDWQVLPDTPEELFRRRAFNTELRLLTGVNRDEAAGFVCEYGEMEQGGLSVVFFVFVWLGSRPFRGF